MARKGAYFAVLLSIALIVFANVASAEDSGLCFLNPILKLFKSVLIKIGIVTTTTTTTSTTTTTTTTESTTTTASITTTTEETTTTTSTTVSTTTTLERGRCNSLLDCPQKIVQIKCRGLDRNLINEETTLFSCFKAGTNESMCKGDMKSHSIKTCPPMFHCVDGSEECVRNT